MSGCCGGGDCCDGGGSDLGFTDEHEYARDDGNGGNSACVPNCKACRRERGEYSVFGSTVLSGSDVALIVGVILAVIAVAIVGFVLATHTDVPANWR